MAKQTSIQYITSLLDKPGAISEADQSSIASFRQSFPYFVPVRYIDALASHRKAAYTPAMLSAVKPYMGDWMMFCAFLQAGGGDAQPAKNEAAAASEPTQKDAPKILNNDNDVVKGAAAKEATPPLKNDNEVVKGADVKPQPQPQAAAKAANEAKSPLTKEVPKAVKEEPIPVKEEPVKEEPAAKAPEPMKQQEEIKAPEPIKQEEEATDPFAALLTGDSEPTGHTAAQAAALPISKKGVVHEIEQNINKQNKHWIVEEEKAPAANPQPGNAAAAGKEKAPESVAEENIDPGAVAAGAGEDEIISMEDIDDTRNSGNGQNKTEEKPLIYPVYTEDYFLQQGVKVSAEIPETIEQFKSAAISDEEKALMVMMSFTEWLMHFKSTSEKQKEETKDQRALKSMWQKEKLAAAMEEENEEIPENVFEMAVNSITKEDGLASESLAEIYIKQEKYDKAIDMYRKLSLRNPQKNAYFARKIEEILKEKLS